MTAATLAELLADPKVRASIEARRQERLKKIIDKRDNSTGGYAPGWSMAPVRTLVPWHLENGCWVRTVGNAE